MFAAIKKWLNNKNFTTYFLLQKTKTISTKITNNYSNKTWQMAKKHCNIHRVVLQQKAYEFVTMLKHVCNIEKPSRKKLVANTQETLHHPTCSFTTKGIRVCYNFETRIQHWKIEEKICWANNKETLQHLTCGFATKCIWVCYNFETRMQH